MKKFISFILMIIMSLTCVAVFGGCTTENSMETVEIDCDVKTGEETQYIKKMDMFNPTWSFMEGGSVVDKYLTPLSSVSELKPENMRVDLFMGYTGIGGAIGNDGADGTTAEEYAELEKVTTALQNNNINPYLVYYANPEYCGGGQDSSSWKQPPDLDAWEELCKNMATYLKENDIQLGGHEIWNEPDFYSGYVKQFFDGEWDEYTDTYIAGAKGVYAGNSDANIGGMSVAWPKKLISETTDGKTNFEYFFDKVIEEDAPIDFISWHYYGYGGELDSEFNSGEHQINGYIDAVREGFSYYEDDELATVAQHLNEFNIQTASQTYHTGYGFANDTYDAVLRLLDATDITRVSWAMAYGQTDAYSLLNRDTHEKYPAYNALWTYAKMPVDRVSYTTSDNISVMSGCDDNRSGTILYNNTDEAITTTINVNNIPFSGGKVKIYAFDEENTLYITQDEPKLIYEATASGNSFSYDINVLPEGGYYVQIDNGDELSDTDYLNPLSDKIVKKEYWYMERDDYKPYADMHENSMTVHMGMNNNSTGGGGVSVIMEDMQNETLSFDVETWGASTVASNSTLGFRVDYEDASGNYVKSQLYTIGGQNNNIAIPFGDECDADEVIAIDGDSVSLDISDNAPSSFNGRIAITFMLKDCAENTTAKVLVKN